jgi:hypothetical protein
VTDRRDGSRLARRRRYVRKEVQAQDRQKEHTPRSLWKWAAGALVPLLLAWAVNYFAPDAWRSVQRLAGAESLEVTVLHAEQFDSELHLQHRGEFIWPTPRSSIPPDATPGEARDRGAVDAGSTLVRLNLRSSFPERVTIQRVGVNVHRSAPLRGTLVSTAGDSGGVANLSFLFASLDEGTVQWVDGDLQPVSPLVIYVDESEEENLDILAIADECYCEWTIEISYVVGGSELQQVTVNPPSTEFFATSAGAAAAIWDRDSCRESPEPGPALCD